MPCPVIRAQLHNSLAFAFSVPASEDPCSAYTAESCPGGNPESATPALSASLSALPSEQAKDGTHPHFFALALLVRGHPDRAR